MPRALLHKFEKSIKALMPESQLSNTDMQDIVKQIEAYTLDLPIKSERRVDTSEICEIINLINRLDSQKGTL